MCLDIFMHMKTVFGSSTYNKSGKGVPRDVRMGEEKSIFTILSSDFYELIIGIHFGEM